MQGLQTIQELLNAKKLNPDTLSPEEETVVNKLFEEKKLTGYNSVNEIKKERNIARSELAQEAERADTPIET